MNERDYRLFQLKTLRRNPWVNQVNLEKKIELLEGNIIEGEYEVVNELKQIEDKTE